MLDICLTLEETTISAGNEVPKMLAPKTDLVNGQEIKKESGKGIDLTPLSKEKQELLMMKLDLSGIEKWE